MVIKFYFIIEVNSVLFLKLIYLYIPILQINNNISNYVHQDH